MSFGTYNTITEAGFLALIDHMKTTRAKADSTESALGGLSDDLANVQSKITFDATPTAGSKNPVESQGIVTYVDSILSNINAALDELNGEDILNAEEATFGG